MESEESVREEYLAELREQGVLPYSILSTRALAFIGCILALHLVVGYWKEFLEIFLAGVEGTGDSWLIDRLLRPFFYLLALPVVGISLFVLLGRFLQLKFLWQANRIAPSLNNINPFRAFSRIFRVQEAFWSTFRYFLGIAFCLSASALLLPRILALSTELYSAKSLIEASAKLLYQLSFELILFCLVLAATGRLVEIWLFRRRHRAGNK